MNIITLQHHLLHASRGGTTGNGHHDLLAITRDGRNFHVIERSADNGEPDSDDGNPAVGLDDLLSTPDPHTLREVHRLIHRCLSSGQSWSYVMELDADDVFQDDIRLKGRLVQKDGESLMLLSISVLDSDRQTLRLRRLKTAFSEMLDTVPHGMAVFDREERLVYFNRQYAATYDRLADIIHIGQLMARIEEEAGRCGQYSDIDGPAAEETVGSSATSVPGSVTTRPEETAQTATRRLHDGRWIRFHMTRTPNGFTVVSAVDITDLKTAEERLEFQARYDSLTGLFNRGTFLERLMKLKAARRRGDVDEGCLILMDLDHFKAVNDTHGHQFGDRYLQHMALRLREAIRSEDLVARLGGDEFIIYMDNIPQADQPQVIDKLHATLSQPMRIDGVEIRPGVSMGVVAVRKNELDIDKVMGRADAALYLAKREGRNRWRNFDPELERRNARRRELLDDLSKAVAEDRITLAFQPQVCLSTGEHVGFEILARWNRDGENVSPVEFITLAEKNGLIMDLGMHVMDRALRWHAGLSESGLDGGRLAVNVSVVQLKNERFVHETMKLIRRYAIDPGVVELEITETAIMERDVHLIERHVRQLAEFGCRIALDDFGTGNATLSHIQRFSVHTLKIDRSFVSQLEEENGNIAIVRAIIGLAHNLDMEVVAEGVETETQRQLLHAFGCDNAQGWLYARPMSMLDAQRWLREHRERCKRVDYVI